MQSNCREMNGVGPRSIRDAVKWVANVTGQGTRVDPINLSQAHPVLFNRVDEYIDEVRKAAPRDPVASLMDCKMIGWETFPVQSLGLLHVAEQALSNEGCVSVRLDGNGKHVLLVPDADTRIDSVKDTAFSWILRGAHVTVLFADGDVPDEFQQCSGRLHAFSLAKLAKDELELLVRNVDIVNEVFPTGLGGVNIPQSFESLRLVRANVDSKLRFEVDDIAAMDLLNFLNPKTGKLAESTVHEFLEVCWALRSVENIAAKPVELLIDQSVPVPDHVIVHATVAALNPFRHDRNRIVLGPSSAMKPMHESAKRLCRFLEQRLGFEVSEKAGSGDGYLRVVNRNSQIAGVTQADSDPFRIASQHLLRGIGPSKEFIEYEFEVLNCKPVRDDSYV